MGTKPLLLDLLDPRARRSVGPELAFPAGSTVSRGKAKGGCDPTPAGEGGGERRDLDKLSVPYSLTPSLSWTSGPPIAWQKTIYPAVLRLPRGSFTH